MNTITAEVYSDGYAIPFVRTGLQEDLPSGLLVDVMEWLRINKRGHKIEVIIN